jgi:hypothetical protein
MEMEHSQEVRRRNLRTGLVLASIALAFAIGFAIRRYFQ